MSIPSSPTTFAVIYVDIDMKKNPNQSVCLKVRELRSKSDVGSYPNRWVMLDTMLPILPNRSDPKRTLLLLIGLDDLFLVIVV